MLCRITGYQPFELMFACRASTVMMLGWGWPDMMIRTSVSKCAWVNKQYKLSMSVNRRALKYIQQSAKKNQSRAGHKPLCILVGNLVLLRDHLEGQNKVQDNHESKLLVIFHDKDPSAYVIQSINKTKNQNR